jgi:hypothetical protein
MTGKTKQSAINLLFPNTAKPLLTAGPYGICDCYVCLLIFSSEVVRVMSQLSETLACEQALEET